MITSKEYELLKEYREQGYKWIARDANGHVYVYQETPSKHLMIWKYGGGTIRIREKCFNFIKWEDEKPTSIADLIRDYESHKEIVGEKVKVTVPQFVADWIEAVKALKRSFKLECLFDTNEMPDDVYDWLDERYGDTDILAKAWLDGYEVEKEKQYILTFRNGQYLYNCDLGMTDKSLGCKLTQSEIESVDPRLMQFAEEVE